MDIRMQMEADVFAYGRYGGNFEIPEDVKTDVDYTSYLFDGEFASVEEFVLDGDEHDS